MIFQEVILNAYHGTMVGISSIVVFSNSKDSVAIASASIALIVAVIYLIDMYNALRNAGALSPALGGKAPQSATAPTSTARNSQVDTTEGTSQQYPSPLGVTVTQDATPNDNQTQSPVPWKLISSSLTKILKWFIDT